MMDRGLRPARRLLAAACVLALTCGPLLLAVPGVAAQDGAPVIASGGEVVLLRAEPGWDAAVQGEAPDGSALQIAGDSVTAADGTLWTPVSANGATGYIPSGYVGAGAPDAAPVDVVDAPVDPGQAPAPDAVAPPAETSDPAAPLPDGQQIISDPATAFDPTVQDPAFVPAAPEGATTTTDTNLRAGPSADASVMQVLPPGTPLSVDGAAENGFVPVTGGGVSGWIAEDLLGAGAAPAAADPALTAPVAVDAAAPVAVDPAVAAPVAAPATDDPNEPGPLVATDAGDTTFVEPAPVQNVPAPPPDVSSPSSTGISWPMSGGEWKVVQGYNNGTHTNRSSFATYKYSLDWARTDDKTAGQPIYAPVSGSIEWTDSGSGGILINAGNGYGVALFHVVLSRGVKGSVTQGQQIGVVAGPGDPGYMNMTHFEIACWKLNANGNHESVPFDGPNTIAGQAFPDTGGANQYMDARVSP
ncbi:MAG: SH3 domain-containing protein [Thermomicrobiales bacterium]